MSIYPPLAPLDPSGAILGDEVFSVLGEAIRDGRLRPGQRLRDVELAAALGVSRTPVREALQRLERIGLVEVSANRYTKVSDPSAELVAETQEHLAYAMGNGLRMSLARCSDESLATQVALADSLVSASAADDIPALITRSFTLYQHVSVATRNRVFLAIMREVSPFFTRSMQNWQPLQTDVAARTAIYRDLRDAIADRDGERAEEIVRMQHGIR